VRGLCLRRGLPRAGLIGDQRTAHDPTHTGGCAARSYAYIDGRVVHDPNYPAERRLSGAPPHSGSLWAGYDPATGIGANVGVFYTGERRTLNSSQVVTPGYATVDAGVSYRIAGRYEARLNVRNALDQRYYTGAQSFTLVFPGAPRTLQASVSAEF
jgi:iron complex outermembrane receptor protein